MPVLRVRSRTARPQLREVWTPKRSVNYSLAFKAKDLAGRQRGRGGLCGRDSPPFAAGSRHVLLGFPTSPPQGGSEALRGDEDARSRRPILSNPEDPGEERRTSDQFRQVASVTSRPSVTLAGRGGRGGQVGTPLLKARQNSRAGAGKSGQRRAGGKERGVSLSGGRGRARRLPRGALGIVGVFLFALPRIFTLEPGAL